MTMASSSMSAALRHELEGLAWPDRFERLAKAEARAETPDDRAQVGRVRAEWAERAIEELRPDWGSLPLKEAILRLPSKRMRGALGQAAKRLRDRSIAEVAARGGMPDLGTLETPGFGRGLDERVVEIPLALAVARLTEPGEVLDAGFALNVPVVREIVGRPVARITHFTLPGSKEPVLAGDEDRFVQAFGDLRGMPYGDASFDRVVCVSTLEHVGLDNARFGAVAERAPDTAHRAVSELIRVLSPGGELLITVPYGHSADHGWFRVFDAATLDELLSPLAPYRPDVRFIYYGDGWATGGSEPPPGLGDGWSSDVVTGVAIVRAVKTGSAH